jgi:hypothetical protein
MKLPKKKVSFSFNPGFFAAGGIAGFRIESGMTGHIFALSVTPAKDGVQKKRTLRLA